MNRKLKLVVAVLATSVVVAGAALAASSPAVSTGAASPVTASSAVLNGMVNPNGASTSYRFEYGLTNAYGLISASKSAGAGSTGVAVHKTVSGLLPGTVYHYRLLASSRSGNGSGRDRKFTTAGKPPPADATGPPAQIGASTATLTGVINPNGAKTSWMFQYGLTTSYGVETFALTVPAGGSPVTVSQPLEGLEPGTSFHYRIVALHGGSVVQYGADGTFFTLPSRRRVPHVRATTTPHDARSAPYVFTTSGRVIGPSSIPQSVSCFQDATVAFFFGRHRVALSLVPIEPDCTFSGDTVFNHLPGRSSKHRQVQLRVQIHFRGNGYLAPSNARPEHVTLG